ncbi:S1-like domain-containing RNA-binding protein [Helicobacter sp. 11S02596-1]|uniref:S1-like domain-containing RNA-binding protein n=1 Tax=Helicobacter sp. 11S02596-1 TaxID=1476194 RepID=UPI000BCFC98E|nr:S1-like domain-containing RNA-binding protein [Helicobacter sp. 11S02596-1]PAF41269.1 hypothetical protein BJI48_08875 [Helicobacter sp. 11S02596-1]
MQIGTIQTLPIARFTQNGAYLKATDTEVLLPNKFLTKSLDVGDCMEVFLYTDSLDRPVATTQKPIGTLGEILALKVVSIEENGCFLDLGIDKDIFMPSKNPKRFRIGKPVVIRLTLDKQNRLIAKLGIKEHLAPFKGKNRPLSVAILPFEITPLGIGCVVNQKYYGLLYKNQTHTPLEIGKTSRATIQKVRPDGKLDLSISTLANLGDEKKRLLDIIAKTNPLELDFNSPPEQIHTICQMSKKSFKTLINALLKENKIKILPHPQDPLRKCICLA